jgi:hypothetical protein
VKEVLGKIKLSIEGNVENPRTKCPLHDLPIEFYCKTCKCNICAWCGMKEHKRHDTEEVDTVVQEITEEAERYLKLSRVRKKN